MVVLSLLSLALAIGCYSISQLIQHGHFKFSKGYYGFWDEKSYERKYKKDWSKDPLGYDKYPAPNNFYYKYIARVKYKERWFTSTNLTVAFTDSYHACQSVSFIFLALAFSLATGFSFWYFWPAIPFFHATVYYLLTRKV